MRNADRTSTPPAHSRERPALPIRMAFVEAGPECLKIPHRMPTVLVSRKNVSRSKPGSAIQSDSMSGYPGPLEGLRRLTALPVANDPRDVGRLTPRCEACHGANSVVGR
jgi:hypothetical protein